MIAADVDWFVAFVGAWSCVGRLGCGHRASRSTGVEIEIRTRDGRHVRLESPRWPRPALRAGRGSPRSVRVFLRLHGRLGLVHGRLPGHYKCPPNSNRGL